MEIRSFLVPTAAALSVATTTACGPAVVGTWDLANITYDSGETYDFPYVYNGTYDGQTIEVILAMAMTIEKDLKGNLVQTYSYSAGGAEPTVDTGTYAVTATKVTGKEYTIKSDDADVGLDFACTIDKKTMACDMQGDSPTTWTFEASEG